MRVSAFKKAIKQAKTIAFPIIFGSIWYSVNFVSMNDKSMNDLLIQKGHLSFLLEEQYENI